jgi:hypothetical protein
MELPVSWNDEVLVVYVSFLVGHSATRTHARFGRVAEPTEHLFADMSGLVIPWRDLVALEGVDPWPHVRIEYRAPGGTDDRLLKIRGADELDGDIRKLFRVVEKRGVNCAVEPGWVGADDVAWERVEALPADEAPEGDPYRGIAPNVETIVARTDQPDTLEWMEGRTSQRMRDHLISTEHLFSIDDVGHVWRLPRAALRAQHAIDGAEVYVFGRKTSVLFRDASCPVAQVLAAQLDP